MNESRAFSPLSQRMVIGALLVAALSFQAVPAPHAPGLHAEGATEISWVDSGCREGHPASFEATGGDRSQACVACLAHFQGRSGPVEAARLAALPILRSPLAATADRHAGSPSSGPPPARGPPLG